MNFGKQKREDALKEEIRMEFWKQKLKMMSEDAFKQAEEELGKMAEDALKNLKKDEFWKQKAKMSEDALEQAEEELGNMTEEALEKLKEDDAKCPYFSPVRDVEFNMQIAGVRERVTHAQCQTYHRESPYLPVSFCMIHI